MLIRSIGKVIRGKATPFQVFLACVLGSCLGFIPGIAQAPGLLAVLLTLLLILNANLVLAGLMAGACKLLSLAVMPLSFQVGQGLLDGPTQAIFRSLINAPGTALLGLDYYVTTGGLAIGLIVGLGSGLVLGAIVAQYRRSMLKLAEGSETFQKFASKGWVKALGWVLLGGGKGKKSYQELLGKRIGNPIRILGVVAILLAGGLIAIVAALGGSAILTPFLRAGLERVNGATVDLSSASISLTRGKLSLVGLAMTDAGAPTTDALRVREAAADINTRDLLRKRIVIDRLVLADATHGEARRVPGRVHPRPTPPPPQEVPGKTLEEYLRDAELWKDRLEQAERWLDEISRRRAEGAPSPGAPGEKQETLRERLEREAARLGLRNVRATHLVEGAPTILVREIAAEGLRSQRLPGETIDLTIVNVSTQPWLVPESPRISVVSSGKTLEADLALDGLSARGGDNRVSLARRRISADAFGAMLAISDTPVLAGGTIDAELTGSLGPGGMLAADLTATILGSTITLPQAGPGQHVDRLVLPIGVRGGLSSPRIQVDPEAFARAFTQAGAQALADKARGKAEKEINEELDKVKEKANDALGDAVGDLLGGRKKKG